MNTLTILTGLQGSGKSTYARSLVKQNEYVRVNRDDLRELMHPDMLWSGKREGIIVATELAMVRTALAAKKNVVVDDTNLVQSTLDRILVVAKEFPEVRVKIYDMQVPIDVCIERDSLREGSAHVGAPVIYRTAYSSGYVKWSDDPRPVVIVDIDGTLANGEHRNEILADKTNPDRWKHYFAQVQGDSAYPVVAQWVQELSKDYQIAIVSGRPDNFPVRAHVGAGHPWTMAEETSMFVHTRCKIPYTALFMRGGNDKRPDTDIKRDIYNQCFKGANVFAILDDRPAVIRETWRKLREEGVIPASTLIVPVRGDIEDF